MLPRTRMHILTLEGSIPHPMRYLSSVAWVVPCLQGFIESQGVENDGIIKGTDEAINLQETEIIILSSSSEECHLRRRRTLAGNSLKVGNFS